jgi:hypothetical protein
MPNIHQVRRVLLRAPAVVAGGSFALTFGQAASHTGNTGTTYQYGTLSYPSGATRLVLAFTTIVGSPDTISAASIGGNALTHVSSTFASYGAFGNVVDIWMSSAPIAGSSGAVEVVIDGEALVTSAVAIYGVTTTTPAVSYSASATPGNGTGPNTLTNVSVPSGGGGIVVANANDKTFDSWTNALNDALLTSGGRTYAFAHTTGSGTFNVDFAWTGGAEQVPLAVATWGP